jgi:hypothetical protein
MLTSRSRRVRVAAGGIYAVSGCSLLRARVREKPGITTNAGRSRPHWVVLARPAVRLLRARPRWEARHRKRIERPWCGWWPLSRNGLGAV